MTNTIVVPRNTPVPATGTKRFFTAKVGLRQLNVQVTQGDTPDVNAVHDLGTLCIGGLPPAEPAGQQVEVTLSFDEQGRLHAHATYVKTGQSLHHEMVMPGCLSDEEVEQYRQYLRDAGLIRRPQDDRTTDASGLGSQP